MYDTQMIETIAMEAFGDHPQLWAEQTNAEQWKVFHGNVQVGVIADEGDAIVAARLDADGYITECIPVDC